MEKRRDEQTTTLSNGVGQYGEGELQQAERKRGLNGDTDGDIGRTDLSKGRQPEEVE